MATYADSDGFITVVAISSWWLAAKKFFLKLHSIFELLIIAAVSSLGMIEKFTMFLGTSNFRNASLIFSINHYFLLKADLSKLIIIYLIIFSHIY